MRHRMKAKRFGRKFNHKKALFRNLIVSLVEHGRIKTTVEKAKELRRHVERAVTVGKKANLASFRLLLSRVPHRETIAKIVKDISPRFKDRPGGYTRIIKIGQRPGDRAEMAFIEWVDFDFKAKAPAKDSKAAVAANAKVEAKKIAEIKTLKTLVLKDHKKSVRKMKGVSRVQNRQ